MADDIPLILLLLGLLALAVFLGASEAALLRVRRSAIAVMAEAGDRRARSLLRLLDDLPRVMNTVLLTVLLVQIGAATTMGLLSSRHFGSLGVSVASVVLTLVLFVYAEAIPKTYALRNPRRVALATGPVIAMLRTALRPVVTVLVSLADLQAPGHGIAGSAGVTEAELRRLAAEAAATGEIAPSDLELMERAFRLGDRMVEQVLVPRIDVVSVAAETSAREALQVAIDSGHRRLPVYEGQPENITAMVRLRDLAAAVAGGAPAVVRDLAVEVLIVPETKRVIELLREMQQSARHFAVAVDEHGSTAGIVTIEDVVAVLVGHVSDEGEQPPARIEELATGRWRVDAAVPISDVEDAIGARLPSGEWNTVGGLVVGLAGRIVSVGASIDCGSVRARVTEATERRILEVEIEQIAEPDEASP